MKALIAMLLILAIISNIKGEKDYSVNTFINYLQDNGIYELLELIKKQFGDDVSIEICKEMFIKSFDCEMVVKVYMSNIQSRGDGNVRNIIDKKKLMPIINEYYNSLLRAGVEENKIKKLKNFEANEKIK